eukprot:5314992-Amphidinium_carterae.1
MSGTLLSDADVQGSYRGAPCSFPCHYPCVVQPGEGAHHPKGPSQAPADCSGKPLRSTLVDP